MGSRRKTWSSSSPRTERTRFQQKSPSRRCNALHFCSLSLVLRRQILPSTGKQLFFFSLFLEAVEAAPPKTWQGRASDEQISFHSFFFSLDVFDIGDRRTNGHF